MMHHDADAFIRKWWAEDRVEEGLAGFVEEFGGLAARDLDADHVLEQISHPAVGSMDFSLEIDRQARQLRPEQARLDEVPGQGGLVVGPIIAASSKGLPNANPTGSRVGRPGKTRLFHERFDQSQVMTVNPWPMVTNRYANLRNFGEAKARRVG
jgi:hypothetical protein